MKCTACALNGYRFCLLPDLPSRLHKYFQLPPHLVFAENCRIDAAEAALGAEAELVDGRVTAGLVDAVLQFVEGFHVGDFGGD